MEAPKENSNWHEIVSRRQWSKQLLTLGMALAACPLPAIGQAEKKIQLQLMVDDVSSLVHLPVMLAHHLGYFKNEGLQVDIVEQTVSQIDNTATGLTAWSVPFEHIVRGNQKETQWMSVMQTGRTPQLALGINKKTMPVFKGLKDLENKKIGVLEINTFSQHCANYLLLQGGVSLNHITYVPVGQSANAIQMLRSSSVDAICFSDPLISLLDKKGEINTVRNLRSTRDTSRVFSGLLPGHSLCVPVQMMEKNPAVCQGLVNAVLRAIKWLRTAGPSDLLHNMTDNSFLPDRAIYLNAVENMRESFTLDGMLGPEHLATVLRMQRTLSLTSSSKNNSLNLNHTNDFVMQARKRLKI